MKGRNTSRRDCPLVWLCSTEDKTDICHHHYHTCSLMEDHDTECWSGSGPGHSSEYRVGDMLHSVTDAYAAMDALGWKRR